MKVAIQGEKASYHHQASEKFFKNNLQIVPCGTFKETFLAVINDQSDFGVVAIENSLYGSINDVYDLLLKFDVYINGETYLRINHQLIGLANTTIDDISEIHTHRVAFAQCEEFLEAKLAHAERFEHHDTAGSVAYIKKLNDSSKAAIASKKAAKLHGLDIIAPNIETNPENYTRFVLISKKPNYHEKTTKTSLVLTTKKDTKAGTLYQALGVFSKRDINLTMLQSRPVVGRAWHYMFYIDIEVSSKSPLFEEACDELTQLGYQTTLLGSYTTTKYALY